MWYFLTNGEPGIRCHLEYRSSGFPFCHPVSMAKMTLYLRKESLTWGRNVKRSFFNWNVALVWRLQECSCHCQGWCLGCPSMENRRTESRGLALVYFQVFKLGCVSIHVWETDEEKATHWFLSLGGGVMDLQLFWVLILRLTSVLTSITISFDILWLQVPAPLKVEGKETQGFPITRAHIKRHLRYLIIGITVVSIFLKIPVVSNYSYSTCTQVPSTLSFFCLPTPDTPFAFIQNLCIPSGGAAVVALPPFLSSLPHLRLTAVHKQSFVPNTS